MAALSGPNDKAKKADEPKDYKDKYIDARFFSLSAVANELLSNKFDDVGNVLTPNLLHQRMWCRPRLKHHAHEAHDALALLIREALYQIRWGSKVGIQILFTFSVCVADLFRLSSWFLFFGIKLRRIVGYHRIDSTKER